MFEDVSLAADELFNDPRFRIVEAVEESKAINQIKGGAIIMSASGMADAGRIKHHLRNNLIRSNATVLFVGYQAPGTLGQIILSGAKEVTIHGETVPVRARVRSLGNYSAHADHSELMAWIKARLPAHGAIFLTHGEDAERAALRSALMQTGLAGDQVIIPLLDDAFDLRAAGVAGVTRPASPRIDPAQLSGDWHNAYAQFVIDLSDRLRSAPSDARRLAIMKALESELIGVAASPVIPVPPPTKLTGSTAVVHGEPSGE
jgi:metallo-beta-lactamase family protein